MCSKPVEASDCATDVTHYVREHPRLDKHASYADYSLIGGNRVEISIANRASGSNHPIEGVHVDLRGGRILEIG
jgi:hypothetical protein